MTIEIKSRPYEVIVTCEGGCGRTVTHHQVTADDPADALRIVKERMAPEGWQFFEGVRCRPCLLLASGWQAEPGPGQLGIWRR